MIFPPWSVLKMHIKKEEVPFLLNFVSKANRHQLLDKWAGTILTQPGMKNLFNDLGISRVITQVRKMTLDRKHADLEYLMWSTEIHTLVAA